MQLKKRSKEGGEGMKKLRYVPRRGPCGWRTAAVVLVGLLTRFPAPAQTTNEVDLDLTPVADEVEKLAEPAPPSRPPIDPAVEPGLLEAMASMKADKWAEAEATLQALHERFPADPDVRKQYSLILIQEEKLGPALDLIEPVLGTEYVDFVVLNNAAWILATIDDRTRRDSARALTLAQDAVLMQPFNFHVWSTLAEAHYASGEFDKAQKAAAEALRLAGRAKAQPEEVEEIARQAAKIRKAREALAIIE